MPAPKGNKFAKGNPGGGRPSGYGPHAIRIAEAMCKLGATDVDLASALEISVTTLDSWKTKYEEFSAVLKAGKEVADERVVRSLYNRAVGYTFDSEKIFQVAGEALRVPVKEHVPPDTTACIFWLKNRRKDQWRDRHEHEVGGVGDFDRMNDVELRQFIAAAAIETSESGEGTEKPGSAGIARGPRRLN